MLRPFCRVTLLASAASLHIPATAVARPSTHAVPAMATFIRGGTTYATAAGSLEEQIKDTVANSKVVVYSKTTCPFCAKTKALFDSMEVDYTAVELNEMENGPEVQAALLSLTGQR